MANAADYNRTYAAAEQRALRELRDEIDGWYVSHLYGYAVQEAVLKRIAEMIAERN